MKLFRKYLQNTFRAFFYLWWWCGLDTRWHWLPRSGGALSYTRSSCNHRLVLRCRCRGRHSWALRTWHLREVARKELARAAKCFPYVLSNIRIPSFPRPLVFYRIHIGPTHLCMLPIFSSIQIHPNYTHGQVLKTYGTRTCHC